MIEFDVNITVKDMYDYNFYHNYRNIGGVLGILIGLICIVLCYLGYKSNANISYTLLMGFMGAFFTVITPFRIYIKSIQQVKLTPMFKKTLNYKIDAENITVSQEDQSAAMPLKDIWKVVDTGKSVIIYVTKVRAYIFPKRDIAEKYDKLCEILKANLTEKQYCIK